MLPTTLVEAFLSRRAVAEDGVSVHTSEMHEAFERYCQDLGVDPAPSIVTFGLVMYRLGYRSGVETEIEKATGNPKIESLRRWQDVRLLPEGI